MFRKNLLRLHLSVALAIGLFLLVVSLTGAILIFETDIDRLLHSHLFYVDVQPNKLSCNAMLEKVHASFPNMRAGALSPGIEPNLSYRFVMNNGLFVYVNPYTGAILGQRTSQEWDQGPTRYVHVLHTKLFAGRAGETITGVVSLLTAFLAISGLILWFPAKTLRISFGVPFRKLVFDAHSALGFYASGVILLITLSGAIIAFESASTPVISMLNKTPEAPRPAKSANRPTNEFMSLDEAIRAANRALPGAEISSITIPTGGTNVITAQMKFPEDHTPAGRSRVFLDQYDGQVLLVESTRTAQTGTWLLNIKRSIHTGDIFGWPTRIIYFLVCLILAGQVVTGMLMWWRRIGRAKPVFVTAAPVVVAAVPAPAVIAPPAAAIAPPSPVESEKPAS